MPIPRTAVPRTDALTADEGRIFQNLLNDLRETGDLDIIAPSEPANAVATAHSASMASRRRLTYTRNNFRTITLRHFLKHRPAVQLWLVAHGTTLPKEVFKIWSSQLDARGTLMHPRVDFYGLARCDAYWTFIAYREKSQRDHRKKI